MMFNQNHIISPNIITLLSVKIFHFHPASGETSKIIKTQCNVLSPAGQKWKCNRKYCICNKSSFQDSFPWIQQRVVKVQSGLTLKNCQMEKLLAKRFYIHIGDGPDFLLKMRKFGWFLCIFADFSDSFSEKYSKITKIFAKFCDFLFNWIPAWILAKFGDIFFT